MSIRPFLFWLHLVAGLLAGIVILVMSVTGVLLTYEKQMVAWAERLPPGAVPEAAERLPVETMLAAARAAKPAATPASVIVRADPREPVTVAYGREGQLLFNPYSGALIGEGAVTLRAFFRSVIDWHRWLAMSGEQRPAGRAVTGASNLLFLVLVVTGACLWLPRTWTWAQVRAVAWFRGGLRGKAREFNWHNAIGVWSVVPLFVVVLSGVVISYPWASNLVYRVAGEAPPAPQRPQPTGRPEASPGRDQRRPAPVAADDGLGSHLARAMGRVEGWRSIAIRVPATAAEPLAFTIDTGSGGQPQQRATLTLDRASGEVVSWEPFEANSPGRRARMILRFAHTGEVLGLPGQTIAGLVSAGGAFLVYTGLALSLRRLLAWRKRRTAPARLAA
jgi:uncharacterized iron-regulated membrane protein